MYALEFPEQSGSAHRDDREYGQDDCEPKRYDCEPGGADCEPGGEYFELWAGRLRA
jgi:hypothetical protein